MSKDKIEYGFIRDAEEFKKLFYSGMENLLNASKIYVKVIDENPHAKQVFKDKICIDCGGVFVQTGLKQKRCNVCHKTYRKAYMKAYDQTPKQKACKKTYSKIRSHDKSILPPSASEFCIGI